MAALENFSEKFIEFLGMLPGAESLDNPEVLAPSARTKRADYLLFQRSMIVEVKQLEIDPAHKVEAIIDRYRSHPSFPLFFGERSLEAVLAHMPQTDREEIRQRVYDSISRSITEGCEDANQQIGKTREHFSLARAGGVLFVLNDRIQILSPNVLGARIEQQMHKRRADGTDRFPEIAFACAVSWAHVVRGSNGVPAHPVLTIEGPAAKRYPVVGEQLDYIIHAWCEHANSMLLDGGKARKELLDDYRSAIPKEPQLEMQRHELWRDAYRKQRYLSAISPEELMIHGNKVFANLSVHFTSGSKATREMAPLLQRWTEFLEECQLRNIDMRQFQPKPFDD